MELPRKLPSIDTTVPAAILILNRQRDRPGRDDATTLTASRCAGEMKRTTSESL